MPIEQLEFLETNGVGFRKQLLARSSTAVMVLVWSEWRRKDKCRLMQGVIEDFAKDPNYLDCVTFWLLNADEYGIACQEISVTDTPCLLIFKDGKEVTRFRDATSEEAIRHQLEVILDRARNYMRMGSSPEAVPQSPFFPG